MSSVGAWYTQKDFSVPSWSTTTWLCSQTMSGNCSAAMRFDRRPTLGISSSLTSYVRSMTYLGIGGSLRESSVVAGCILSSGAGGNASATSGADDQRSPHAQRHVEPADEPVGPGWEFDSQGLRLTGIEDDVDVVVADRERV